LELRLAQTAQQSPGAPKTTAVIGRFGKVGKPGKKRMKGLPNNEVLDQMVIHFDDVYRQLNEQLRLIAKIQQQVSGLVATVGRLSGH
jgi:hypothetical protein